MTQVKKANVIKATTDEIHAILGILSMCSILQTPKHVGYLETLPLNHLRVFSGDNDHYYPLVFWRGKDGINDQAVKAIFGESADKHLNPELIKLTVSKLEYELEKNSHKRKKSKGEQYFKPNQYVITLTEEERKYLGLEPMLKTYEAETTYSSTNLVHKRTTLIYNGDTIVKVISEERKITSDSAYDHTMYIEYDTYLKTDNRQWLLPLTKRGKKKSITPSSVTSITSKKCVFNIQIREKHSSIHICNTYNQQDINLFDLDEEIRQIQTEEEFHDFMEKYKTTCPTYYFDRIEEMKNMPAQTVKFKEGDIFRCEYGRNQYYYGLIIGKVRKIEKWKELPSKHSFRNLMGQPIMIRMYDLTTTRKDMTAEELSFIPLMPVKICDDWDIIRGRHPIVGHKVLEPSDIEFKFICTQITSENKHKTLFTDQILKGIFLENKNKEYKLYIEWGFAQTEILYNQLTDELKVYMATDSSYEGGVSLGINNLFLKQDENKLKMIFRCLGISEETTFDEFAKLYGGITRALYISLI